MANKKINELSTRTPSLSDLMVVGDPTSGYSYKCTVTSLATIIETDIADAYVTLDTAQTISGAKTFSNNLTLTSVTNAAVAQDKFLTLNGSNIVNYRTAAQVLSDIGAASASSLSGYVPTSRTLTINGTSYDLSANRSWSVGTVTSVAATAGTGISISGSPITSSGTLTITNTAPDQTVVLTAGTGISVSGTYPNFTITNSSPSSGGTVTSVGLTTGTTGTDISVSGSPITSSGTITLNIPTASATNRGALSSTDWTTFNNKQNALTLTTTGTSGAATLVGATLNIPQYQGVLTNPVTGTGTTNYIPKFTGTSAIGNSLMQEVFSGISFGGPIYAADGTSTSASIRFYNSNSGFYYPGSDGLGFITAATEKMRLTSAGSLGLGTSSPSALLHIYGGNALISGSSTPSILFNDGGTQSTFGMTSSTVKLESGGYPVIFNASSTQYIAFQTNSTERMRLDASGNLGLGTSSPSYKLDVSGTSRILLTSTTSPTLRLDYNATSNYATHSMNANGDYVIASPSSNGVTSGNLDLQAGSTIKLFTNNTATNVTPQLTLDASGNLGLGVTPSAWGTGYKAIQFNDRSSVYQSTTSTYLANNLYVDNVGLKYITTNTTAAFGLEGNKFVWYQAASGTAGTAISFTQAMTLDASGNLGIGSTSPSNKLQISAAAGSSHARWTESATTVGFVGGAQGIITGLNGSFAVRGENGLVLSGAGNAANLYINSSGNVGIGTTSPTGLLHLYGADPAFRIQNSGTGNMQFGQWDGTYNRIQSSGRDFLLISTDATNLLFSTNSTERMRITSGGQVGIANTIAATMDANNGSGQLVVGSGSGSQVMTIYSGSTSGNEARLTFANASTGGGAYSAQVTFKSGDNAMLFYNQNAERMRITSGGNVLVGTSTDAGSYKLQVNGNIYSTGDLTLNNGSADGAQLILSSSGYSDWNIDNYNGNLRTYYGSTEYFRITNGGQVGIGLTNPTAALEVNGGIKTSAPIGGTAQQWKFGSKVNATVALITGSYIELEVGGTLYKLAIVN